MQYLIYLSLDLSPGLLKLPRAKDLSRLRLLGLVAQMGEQ